MPHGMCTLLHGSAPVTRGPLAGAHNRHRRDRCLARSVPDRTDLTVDRRWMRRPSAMSLAPDAALSHPVRRTEPSCCPWSAMGTGCQCAQSTPARCRCGHRRCSSSKGYRCVEERRGGSMRGPDARSAIAGDALVADCPVTPENTARRRASAPCAGSVAGAGAAREGARKNPLMSSSAASRAALAAAENRCRVTRPSHAACRRTIGGSCRPAITRLCRAP